VVQFNPLVPELTVSDLDVSLAFYVGVLGFRVVVDRPEDRFAFIQHERVQLMIEEARDGNWQTEPLDRPFGRGINFEIRVRDVDVLLSRLAAADVELFRPLSRTEYRTGDTVSVSVEFLVQDPDGYLLRFALDDEPARPDQPSTKKIDKPTIWKLAVLVETDDEEVIDRLRNDIASVVCPHDPASDHACDTAWFLVASPLDDDEAERWRPELNR
jgi:catechol 2,3-dioxygenase-like lactoylglutathione lyase family enzyme